MYMRSGQKNKRTKNRVINIEMEIQALIRPRPDKANKDEGLTSVLETERRMDASAGRRRVKLQVDPSEPEKKGKRKKLWGTKRIFTFYFLL